MNQENEAEQVAKIFQNLGKKSTFRPPPQLHPSLLWHHFNSRHLVAFLSECLHVFIYSF